MKRGRLSMYGETEAVTWVEGNPRLKPLEDFASNWLERDPARSGFVWPKSVSCIDLLYALVSLDARAAQRP